MAQAFNLRGTNGSGKTFVARHILKLSWATPCEWASKKKPLVYAGTLFNRDVVFFGSYVTDCGGCDTIPSVSRVAELLHHYMKKDVLIFYEGLMISHMIGTVGAAAATYNDNHWMGFLDTPIDTCISRVVQRRLERGNPRPFDPNRTLVRDYRAVQQARANAEKQGFNVVSIRHGSAVKDTLHYLKWLAEQ